MIITLIKTTISVYGDLEWLVTHHLKWALVVKDLTQSLHCKMTRVEIIWLLQKNVYIYFYNMLLWVRIPIVACFREYI